jgi:hypothetical protein
VPVERDGTQHKTDEREGTVKLVRRERHSIPRMCNTQKPKEMGAFLNVLNETASAAGPLKRRVP